MKEELIKFETAKLAKEKGFNVYVEHMQTYFSHEMWDNYLYPNSDVGDFQYSETAKRTKDIGFALNENYPVPFYEPYYMCPTQSFLQKWLREKHGLILCVNYTNIQGIKWGYDIHGRGTVYVGNSYEECLEAGLVEALNMIKI